MFIIKFEQLIPRLQRYFNLDRWRKALMDFDPTPENERLSNLLGLQAGRSHTPDAVNDLLDSIRSIHWQGFREKDSALQLVLKAYNNINQELGLKDGMHNSQDPEIIRLHKKMLETVRHVGYPSQILHHAQILKRSLRETKNLIEAASKPRHPRFLEAWLLLSTADFTRHPPEDRMTLLNFLENAAQTSRLWTREPILFKALDALANVGRICEPQEEAMVNRVLCALAKRTVDNNASPDNVCLLLDTLLHLDTHMQGPADFDKESHDRLEAYIHVLQDDLGTNHPDVIAMMSRWQEFRIRSEAA